MLVSQERNIILNFTFTNGNLYNKCYKIGYTLPRNMYIIPGYNIYEELRSQFQPGKYTMHAVTHGIIKWRKFDNMNSGILYQGLYFNI